MSFSLADVPPNNGERSCSIKPPRWIPLPALADAFKRIWEGQRENNYGRPPPIGCVLEECTRSRLNLINVKCAIAEIDRTRQGLQKIIAATEDSYHPDDGPF